MPSKDNDALLQRLLAIFQVEAAEHLTTMAALLQEMRQARDGATLAPLLETLFREAHSLKGAARSVNRTDLEAVCMGLEGTLAQLKRQVPEQLPAAWFDNTYRTVDELQRLLAGRSDEEAAAATPPAAPTIAPPTAIEATAPPAATPLVAPASPAAGTPAAPSPSPAGTATPAPAPAPALAASKAAPLAASATPPASGKKAGKASAKSASPTPPTSDTVRISTARLTALLVQSEELLAFKFSAAHRSDELHALRSEVATWRKQWSRGSRDWRPLQRQREKHGPGWRPDARALPAIDKLLDSVEHQAASLKALHERLARLEGQARQEQRALAGIIDGLQGDIRRALMLPFATLLELFPKLVRDLARDNGKEVELQSSGSAIEIDRRILEQLKDPLIHLIRNAVDHGIESPAARRQANKPPLGRISIELTPREGNRIELLIADDGAGVDLAKVQAAAVKIDLLGSETAAKLGRGELLALMFESGLTTSPILTELSGRGLGLAIVREKVELLDGSIDVEQPVEGGTRFRLLLPTSLATFHGLLVQLGERQFVLPSRSVERVLRLTAGSVKTVENREAVEIGGRALSLVRLADVLGLPARSNQARGDDYLSLVVLSGAGRRIAFVVDRIIGDQEVLVKGLGPQLARVPNIAGATLLGNGQLVPILNVADLLQAALRSVPQGSVSQGAAPAPAAGQPQRSLLVVEDSITARSLLKSILETAGYRVETAVDGADALTLLHTAEFDLVVSDVEMPRLDGFELTARIRADKKLADLPVVLVTALESREDKERGIEVGANAYIVKSSFDQSNLFEVIRRLT
jgi:two-component system chemotaxis sensor kinase CheA